MKISIVTPSFNHARFIERTIRSVLEQDHDDVEHIIQDGGSTDDTVRILRSFPHLQWESARDEGQTDALVKGFSKATGEILAWINSDDYYEPNVLGAVASHFAEHPDCMFLYGDMIYVDAEGRPLFARKGPIMTYERLVKYPDIVRQASCFWRRAVLDEAGGLDNRIQIVMDYDFFLRAARKFKFHHLPLIVSNYRTYPENKSNSMAVRQAMELYRVYRKNGIPITVDRAKYLFVKLLDAAGIGTYLRPLYRPFKRGETLIEEDHPVR